MQKKVVLGQGQSQAHLTSLPQFCWVSTELMSPPQGDLVPGTNPAIAYSQNHQHTDFLEELNSGLRNEPGEASMSSEDQPDLLGKDS